MNVIPDAAASPNEQEILYSFRYTYTYKDALSLKKYLDKKNKKRKTFRILLLYICTLVVFGGVICLVKKDMQQVWQETAKSVLLLSIGCFLLVRLFNYSVLYTLYRFHEDFEEVDFTITSEGIKYGYAGKNQDISWAEIISVEVLHDSILLIINSHGGYVIPLRAVEGRQNFMKLAEQLTEWHKKYRIRVIGRDKR